jgi:hypothetical protein
LPRQFFIPAIVATVTLFLTGLFMLRRQTVRRRLQAMHAEPEPRRAARPYERRPLEPERAAS